MWRQTLILLAIVPRFVGGSIVEHPLDVYRELNLPVSSEVTTITLPGPLTAVVGADMLIDDGKVGRDETTDESPLRFQVTHPPGANFVLVRSIAPMAAGRLTLIFEGGAYVMQLHTVTPEASIASVILRRPRTERATPLSTAPEPVKFTPRIGLSLLDRARAYPVLARSLPKAVEGVTLSVQSRTIDLPDLEVTVQEVYRFSVEDAVVFLLRLRNKTDQWLDLAPSTFAARVGDEKFTQAIANGPRALGPGESAEAEFAIVGMPDGTRNDLRADNAFTVLVSSGRRSHAATGLQEGGPKS